MSEADPSSIFHQKKSRLPEDTVFFTIFPDISLSLDLKSQNLTTNSLISTQLQSLHLQILHSLSSYTSNYIWQHEPFTISLSTHSSCAFCPSSSNHIPHLHGKLRYGDNLEDEWFVVYLLFETSRKFPNLSIRVWDTDGEFLLIEAAFHLPKWLNPETSTNRVFIRGGNLHIVPESHFRSVPTLFDALSYVSTHEDKTIASSSIQLAIRHRIGDYPDRAVKNMHRVRVRVPVLVAHILKHEPCLISLAVEGFYDRDIDSMKYAASMERFLPPNKRVDEIVEVSVIMSRAMYAQLMQQTFQAPKGYPMPPRSDGGYAAAELGMKIACGFEMIYQMRKRERLEGKGSTWEVYKESLEKSGYFEGLLPGSKEYKRLMENAQDYYRKSSLHYRESEIMSAPVRRIDEILSHPVSADDFKGHEIPPSDDDSWLYNGEDELNAALLERQQEMEHYDLNHKKNNKSKEQEGVGPSSSSNLHDYDLGDIAKSMQEFIQNMSSFEGAEVPGDRNSKAVDIDVDRFMKEIESVMKPSNAGGDNDNDDEDLSSDMDLDDSEDSDNEEDEDEQTAFMDSYSDALSKELKSTTLDKSFDRANEPPLMKDEGTSNVSRDADEFTPVDVDLNLVKSFLGSFSSQEGLPGPASNLLGLMGLQLPQDDKKGK